MMSLIQHKNWRHSRHLKLLLVMIGLQLVVLQVKALSAPVSMNQPPCRHTLALQAVIFQHINDISEPEYSSELYCDCEDVNLDCDHCCDAFGLFSLAFNTGMNLLNVRYFFYSEGNKIFIAVTPRPAFKPP